MPARKRQHACCHTPLHQCGQIFCLQGNACEDARNLCATGSPVCCTKTFPLTIRKNITPKTLSRETSNARDVTLQARWQTLIQTVAPLGPLHLFSFHSRVNKMSHNWWHRARACHFVWLRGGARQVCVNVLSGVIYTRT